MVRVRGRVKRHFGSLMIVTHPTQIKVLPLYTPLPFFDICGVG
jgi:hypothetical protein